LDTVNVDVTQDLNHAIDLYIQSVGEKDAVFNTILYYNRHYVIGHGKINISYVFNMAKDDQIQLNLPSKVALEYHKHKRIYLIENILK
jgi:hypothetical protein